MHPHKAAKNIGVVALKRLKCTTTTTKGAATTKCTTFKTAMCIKSNKKHFKSKREEEATLSELKGFADYVKANAWDNAGTSTAKLKTGWGCHTADQKKAQDF